MDANTYSLQFILVYLSSKIIGISCSMVYTFSLTSTTWNQAQEHCESRGSRLVTLTDETAYDEFTAVYKEMQDTHTILSTTDMWIGLYDKTPPSGSYRWTDCSSLTFSKWTGSEPNSLQTERCVRLSTSCHFKTRQCNRNFVFACERPVCSEEDETAEVIQPLFHTEPERQSSEHKCDSPVDLICPERDDVTSSSTAYSAFTTSTTYATSSENQTPGTITKSALEATLDSSSKSEHLTSSEDIRTSSTTMEYFSTTFELTLSASPSTPSSDIDQTLSTQEVDSTQATSTGHDLQTSEIVATVTENSPASSTTLEHTTPSSTTPDQRVHNRKITEECTCVCKNTEKAVSSRLLDIKKKLIVNITSLSSHRRKLTSAEDNRKSASVSGSLGIVVIVVMVTVFVMADIQRLCMWAKYVRK